MALLAFALSRDGEYTVEDFDIDILLLETGELEGSCYAIGFVVDVKVEPTMGRRSQYCVEGFLGGRAGSGLLTLASKHSHGCLFSGRDHFHYPVDVR